jgi:hypothetical protein
MVLALLASLLAPLPSGAATSERIVADRHRGLAIDGFDPVAYFVDGKPLPGRGEWEHRFAGATWRFRNEGNRAAFMQNPDAYLPRFGGYDPVGVARGVAVAGNPTLWLLADGKLWLFYNEAALDEFFNDAGRIAAAAERMWPEVLRALVP